MKKICVIGLGYIGLPTAIIAANHNFEVVGFDVDHERVRKINNGDPVIKEPDIYHHLCQALATGNLKATTTITAADYFIIAVPTPITDQKKADLSFVWQATNSIAPVLKKGNTVIIESTISVGTSAMVAHKLQQATGLLPGEDFYVAHCPERVLPGKIFYELTHNPRIIGGINHASLVHACAFYEQFALGPMHGTDATTAELIKLVENSYRDVAIAFANQVAAMAYALDLNPFTVIDLANKHPRVSILKPSCGVGGHCIAVDPWFLVETFPKQTQLLATARIINDQKPLAVIGMIHQAIDEWENIYAHKPTILLLGLTYKADVDDLRESPALSIAQTLSKTYAHELLICEPNLEQETLQKLFPNRHIVPLKEGLDKAHIIVNLVPHKQFSLLKQSVTSTHVILDICGLMHTSDLKPHSSRASSQDRTVSFQESP